MTARKALTRTEIILLCQRQALGPILCGCGCGEPLDPVTEKVVDEHGLPRKLCEPGREAERDVLENRSFYRWPCAVAKTSNDLTQIAKAKAQGGETGQYARRQRRGGSSIKGGGFGPQSSKFDGSIGLTKKAQRLLARGDEPTDSPSLGGYGAKRNEQKGSTYQTGETGDA